MLTKLACRACGGSLVAEPADGDYDVDHLKCLSCARTEPLPEVKPVPIAPTWSCGCERTDANYLIRSRQGVTYAGCRACWSAEDAG